MNENTKSWIEQLAGQHGVMIHPHDRAVSSGHGGLAPAATRPQWGGLIAHTEDEEVEADEDRGAFYFIFYILYFAFWLEWAECGREQEQRVHAQAAKWWKGCWFILRNRHLTMLPNLQQQQHPKTTTSHHSTVSAPRADNDNEMKHCRAVFEKNTSKQSLKCCTGVSFGEYWFLCGSIQLPRHPLTLFHGSSRSKWLKTYSVSHDLYSISYI